MFFSDKWQDALYEMDKRVKKAFSKIKEESEEHLNAINENTNEIQSNYEFLCRLEAKIDKLDEKVNEIAMTIDQFKKKKTYSVRKVDGSAQKFQIGELTPKEMQTFIALYTMENTKDGATYKNIALKLGISESLVQNYVTNLIEKGIPIIKKYLNGMVYLRLDNDFKSLQAKKNILNVDEKVTEKLN